MKRTGMFLATSLVSLYIYPYIKNVYLELQNGFSDCELHLDQHSAVLLHLSSVTCTIQGSFDFYQVRTLDCNYTHASELATLSF